MTKEPATHKKVIYQAQIRNDLLVLLEIGIRYHGNRYTPETAYFVSLNGRGKRFTGKTAQLRAYSLYGATKNHLESEALKQAGTQANS